MFSAIKPFLDLCRISNLPTVWTNVLAAVVLSGVSISWVNFVILALSMSLFYCGGMCLNDISDADKDRLSKPFRPIPSGRISAQSAYILTTALFISALSLLVALPHKAAVYAGLFLIAIIVAYDVYHKAHPLSVVLMATCRSLIFVVSALAVSGTVGQFVVMAGALQFVYTLLISVVARHENKRGITYTFPIVPTMIACISLLDGMLLASFASVAWLVAGMGGAALTHTGQNFIKGD